MGRAMWIHLTFLLATTSYVLSTPLFHKKNERSISLSIACCMVEDEMKCYEEGSDGFDTCGSQSATSNSYGYGYGSDQNYNPQYNTNDNYAGYGGYGGNDNDYGGYDNGYGRNRGYDNGYGRYGSYGNRDYGNGYGRNRGYDNGYGSYGNRDYGNGYGGYGNGYGSDSEFPYNSYGFSNNFDDGSYDTESSSNGYNPTSAVIGWSWSAAFICCTNSNEEEVCYTLDKVPQGFSWSTCSASDSTPDSDNGSDDSPKRKCCTNSEGKELCYSANNTPQGFSWNSCSVNNSSAGQDDGSGKSDGFMTTSCCTSKTGETLCYEVDNPPQGFSWKTCSFDSKPDTKSGSGKQRLVKRGSLSCCTGSDGKQICSTTGPVSCGGSSGSSMGFGSSNGQGSFAMPNFQMPNFNFPQMSNFLRNFQIPRIPRFYMPQMPTFNFPQIANPTLGPKGRGCCSNSNGEQHCYSYGEVPEGFSWLTCSTNNQNSAAVDENEQGNNESEDTSDSNNTEEKRSIPLEKRASMSCCTESNGEKKCSTTGPVTCGASLGTGIPSLPISIMGESIKDKFKIPKTPEFNLPQDIQKTFQGSNGEGCCSNSKGEQHCFSLDKAPEGFSWITCSIDNSNTQDNTKTINNNQNNNDKDSNVYTNNKQDNLNEENNNNNFNDDANDYQQLNHIESEESNAAESNEDENQEETDQFTSDYFDDSNEDDINKKRRKRASMSCCTEPDGKLVCSANGPVSCSNSSSGNGFGSFSTGNNGYSSSYGGSGSRGPLPSFNIGSFPSLLTELFWG